MKKVSSKTILVVVIILVVVVIVYRNQKNKENLTANAQRGSSISQTTPTRPATPTPTTNTSTVVSRPSSSAENQILKRGSRGSAVSTLQSLYNINFATKNNKPILVVDGVFGPLTEQAVKNVTGQTSVTLAQFKTALKVSNQLSSWTAWLRAA